MDRKTVLRVFLASFAGSFITVLCGTVAKLSKLKGTEINFCFAVCSVFLSLLGLTKDTDNVQFSTENIRKLAKSLTNGAIANGMAQYCFFVAFDLLPYSDAYAICAISFFVTTIAIESIKLKKVPQYLTCIAAIISLSGLIFFAQPENFVQNVKKAMCSTLLGVFCAATSGFSFAIFYLNLQFMKTYPIGFHWLAFSVGSLLSSFVNLAVNGIALSQCLPMERLVGALACLVWPFYSLSSIIGSQLSLPSIMQLLRLTSIVMSYVLQVVLLGQTPTIFSFLGALSVCVGVTVQVVSMYRLTAQPKVRSSSEERKWYKF